MAINRMEVLQNMLAQKPQDSFARYGLAMEYANQGNLEQAVSEYRTLLEHNPKYAPAYFHNGQTLEKLGRVEEAAEAYRKGIEVAAQIGDEHTRGELQGALDMLPI